MTDEIVDIQAPVTQYPGIILSFDGFSGMTIEELREDGVVESDIVLQVKLFIMRKQQLNIENLLVENYTETSAAGKIYDVKYNECKNWVTAGRSLTEITLSDYPYLHAVLNGAVVSALATDAEKQSAIDALSDSIISAADGFLGSALQAEAARDLLWNRMSAYTTIDDLVAFDQVFESEVDAFFA